MPRRRKCGCAEGQCFCRFEDSESVVIVGGGDQPYSFEVVPALETLDTPSMTWNFDGSVLSATAFSNVDVQIFESSGTYTRPPLASLARILLIGGGSAGFNGVDDQSGQGGTGGSVLISHLTATSIPASAPVVIGLGGTAPGQDGGDSSFNTQFFAQGGDFGLARNVQCPGAYVLSYEARRVDPPYLDWERIPPEPLLGWPFYVPGGGGRGYGLTPEVQEVVTASAGMWSLPTKGARPFPVSDQDTGGLSGGINLPGTDEPVTLMGGGGGGGGPGQPGQPGGKYGAGGGGGGAPGLGLPPTPGGAGADGFCMVLTW